MPAGIGAKRAATTLCFGIAQSSHPTPIPTAQSVFERIGGDVNEHLIAMANSAAHQQIRASHGLIDLVVDCLAFVAAIAFGREFVVWYFDAGPIGVDTDWHRGPVHMAEHRVDVCGRCGCVWAIANHIWPRRWRVAAAADGSHQIV